MPPLRSSKTQRLVTLVFGIANNAALVAARIEAVCDIASFAEKVQREPAYSYMQTRTLSTSLVLHDYIVHK